MTKMVYKMPETALTMRLQGTTRGGGENWLPTFKRSGCRPLLGEGGHILISEFPIVGGR